jgi:hypothetical protein
MPTLCVAYRKRQATGAYDHQMMMLLAVRMEALGAITPEGLVAAGYEGDDAFARFRREWTIHEKKRFVPLRRVMVFTVRKVDDEELLMGGRSLVDHLYGEFLARR